jgi:RNA polymerase sigma-70 factor (ECF subfamily)
VAHDAADDHNRLTRWVVDHGEAVLGYLSALVRDRAAAEDLLQEVFCRAWEARARYDDRKKERGYLLTIADRLARTKARSTKREIVVDDAAWDDLEPIDPRGSPPASLEQREIHRMLGEALDELSEPQRRALLLRYYGEMSYQEIAEAMHCPLSTALSHCHRGLSALRRLWVEDRR